MPFVFFVDIDTGGLAVIHPLQLVGDMWNSLEASLSVRLLNETSSKTKMELAFNSIFKVVYFFNGSADAHLYNSLNIIMSGQELWGCFRRILRGPPCHRDHMHHSRFHRCFLEFRFRSLSSLWLDHTATISASWVSAVHGMAIFFCKHVHTCRTYFLPVCNCPTRRARPI